METTEKHKARPWLSDLLPERKARKIPRVKLADESSKRFSRTFQDSGNAIGGTYAAPAIVFTHA
jgi:hypothetical protein